MSDERLDWNAIDQVDEAEYVRLAQFLDAEGLAVARPEVNRLTVEFTRPDSREVAAEILMTPHEWSQDMIGVLYGDFVSAAQRVVRMLQDLSNEDRYLVFVDYTLEPQSTPTLPDKTRRQREQLQLRRFPDDRLASLTYLRSSTALPIESKDQVDPPNVPPTGRGSAIRWLLDRHPELVDLLRRFDADPVVAAYQLPSLFEEEDEFARAWREYRQRHPQPDSPDDLDAWWDGAPAHSERLLVLRDLDGRENRALQMIAMLSESVPFSAGTAYGVRFPSSRTEFVDDWLRVVATGAGRWDD